MGNQEASERSIKELLDLAEKKKLDIEDLSISDITGRYLSYIKAQKTSGEEITEYLVQATKLLSLKLKVLMPDREQSPLEEDDEDQIAEELAKHLMEYRTFKEAAELFRERFEEEPKTYVRNMDFSNYVSSVGSSSSLEGLCLGDLVNALEKVLQRDTALKNSTSYQVPRQEFKVADKIKEVLSLVSRSGASGIEFENLFSQHAEKSEIIATFLALLELVRMHKVRIIQERTFGTIVIYYYEDAAPST